jgi:hypothetical protein
METKMLLRTSEWSKELAVMRRLPVLSSFSNQHKSVLTIWRRMIVSRRTSQRMTKKSEPKRKKIKIKIMRGADFRISTEI